MLTEHEKQGLQSGSVEEGWRQGGPGFQRGGEISLVDEGLEEEKAQITVGGMGSNGSLQGGDGILLSCLD